MGARGQTQRVVAVVAAAGWWWWWWRVVGVRGVAVCVVGETVLQEGDGGTPDGMLRVNGEGRKGPYIEGVGRVSGLSDTSMVGACYKRILIVAQSLL